MGNASGAVGVTGALLLGLALAALGGPPAAHAGPAVVGEVAAVVGAATAEWPGQEPRPLACGDSVYDGEIVRTGADSLLGILAGDLYANLADQSTVRLGLTPDGLADLELEAGRIRVVDARDAGAPAGLGAVGARARVVANDAEAYVLAEKVGRYAMFCDYEAPLEVGRGTEKLSIGPGDCVIAKPREPLYTARAHDERIPLAGLETCEPAGPAIGSPIDRFAPTDVAAPPIQVVDFLGPPDVGPSPRDACDDPGSGCAGGRNLGLIPPDPIGGLPPGAQPNLGD